MLNKAYLPCYEGCLVCGSPEVNPHTLNRKFEVSDDGVQCSFCAGEEHIGYKGVVHGGIICALLDETIGWAVAVERRKFFVTGELTVRFVRPLPVGLTVTVRGRAVEHKSKYSVAEGKIIDDAGVIYAKASGKFFLMKDEDAERVNAYLSYDKNDLNVLEVQ